MEHHSFEHRLGPEEEDRGPRSGQLAPDRSAAMSLELGKGAFMTRSAYNRHPRPITIVEEATLAPGVIILAPTQACNATFVASSLHR